MKNDQTNLNKYISASGFCSRREVDKLIEQARVTVNGELVLPGAKVEPGDIIEVDGEPIKKKTKERPIYIAFNKPVGVTSTTDVKDRSNIIYYMDYPKRIFPIGRLDKDSDGLIFLTNDGDIVNKILRASNFHEKEYLVIVDKAITPEFIHQMGNGVPVLGEVTRKCFVRQEGARRFRIILTQGLNRQVRRMCEYLGYSVKELRRTRIMNVALGDIPPGKWRYFTPAEIDKLNELVAESSNAAPAKSNKERKAERAVQYIPKKKPKPEAEFEDVEDFGRPQRKGKPARPEKAGAPKGKPKAKETAIERFRNKANSRKKDAPVERTKAKGKPAAAPRDEPKRKLKGSKTTAKSDGKKPKPSGKFTAYRDNRKK